MLSAAAAASIGRCPWHMHRQVSSDLLEHGVCEICLTCSLHDVAMLSLAAMLPASAEIPVLCQGASAQRLL